MTPHLKNIKGKKQRPLWRGGGIDAGDGRWRKIFSLKSLQMPHWILIGCSCCCCNITTSQLQSIGLSTAWSGAAFIKKKTKLRDDDRKFRSAAKKKNPKTAESALWCNMLFFFLIIYPTKDKEEGDGRERSTFHPSHHPFIISLINPSHHPSIHHIVNLSIHPLITLLLSPSALTEPDLWPYLSKLTPLWCLKVRSSLCQCPPAANRSLWELQLVREAD